MGVGREMIDWTKPIETVDGREAKVLSRGYWRNGETYCVVQVENPETGDSEILIVYPITGYGHAAMAASTKTIRNVRVKRKAWIRLAVHDLYKADTKEEIEAWITNPNYKAVYAEWEEEP
jgi:hypothetical protein